MRFELQDDLDYKIKKRMFPGNGHPPISSSSTQSSRACIGSLEAGVQDGADQPVLTSELVFIIGLY